MRLLYTPPGDTHALGAPPGDTHALGVAGESPVEMHAPVPYALHINAMITQDLKHLAVLGLRSISVLAKIRSHRRRRA